MKEEPDASVAKGSFTRLIIYQDKKTKAIDKKIVTYIPDKWYLKKHQGDASSNWLTNINSDFTGYIEYRNWDNSLLKIVRLLDGAIIHQFQLSPLNNSGKKQVQAVVKTNDYCVTTTVDYYTYGCTRDGEGNITCCGDPVYSGSGGSTVDCYSSGGGGGSTPDPGNGSGGGSSGGGTSPAVGLNQDNLSDFNSLLQNNDEILIRCDSLRLLSIQAFQNYGRQFQDVANYIPPTSVGGRINNIGEQMGWPDYFNNFQIQSLFDATGPIVNCDYFPVKITQLPNGMSAADLTEYFRLHINDFISPSLNTSFVPYQDQYINDVSRFNSPGAQSMGSMVHIHMADDGTVIESDYGSNANHTWFKFSTLTSPLDYSHPVSGNREFGVYNDPNRPGEFTFYTSGVDRTSDWLFAIVNGMNSTVFKGADELWSNMQQNMINFVISHGGVAGYYNQKSYVARPEFALVKNYLMGGETYEQLKHDIGCD